MKWYENMSIEELEYEIKFVESRISCNPAAPDYLRLLKRHYENTLWLKNKLKEKLV